MFPSVSRAIPQTQITSSFIASRAMTIEIVSFNDFYIEVNGIRPINYRNIVINAGDAVVAFFTTAADFLWYKFFYYKIDNVPQSFAAVNKSQYTLRVKTDDATKRWFLYNPTIHELTYRSVSGSLVPITLGGTAADIVGNYHVILEPVSSSVYFFSELNGFVSRVIMSADPIDYVRNPLRNSIIVLIRSGEVYEIFLNSNAQGLAPFVSLRNFSEFTGDLTYLTRLPGEDLITYLRRLRNRLAIPPATCITRIDNLLIAGGNGTVWVVDLSLGFQLLNTIPIDEYVSNIVALPDKSGVLVVTQSQKIYKVLLDGTVTQIYNGASLWQPALFNGKIYIPECNIQGDTSPTSFNNEGRLLIWNHTTQSFETPITLFEFAPSYITLGSGKMYVCGHDSERVLEFNSQLQITEIFFNKKVTWVSELNGTLIASHYLASYKILSALDLHRIIEVDFNPRTGPVSYIGTNTETVKSLGAEEIVARTPVNTWIWINGKRSDSNKPQGVALIDGDYISLSYAAKVAGQSRTNCVIGDTAYDYDINAVAQTYYPRHIDLPIATINDYGIHNRIITLPKFFTPCLMSLEYGALRVNGALYLGNALVYPEDQVEIEIRACKTTDLLNSVLPIFTIGARQYVIPVAVDPSIATVLVQDSNLTPGVSLVKTITLTGTANRADFIIPGYYDVIIKKNNIDITGNYYQQFGKNDVLIVEFTASRKRYDERDVYILGAPNYRFNAQNLIENRIGFLNYGAIADPYPRFSNYYSSLPKKNLGINYQIANYFSMNNYQYYSSSLTITGLTGNSNGNITLNGVDSYFIHNGNIITSTQNIEVKQGDTLALCRNIHNFFAESITITQWLPDPNDDFYVNILVGTWGVVNQTIVEPPDIFYQTLTVDEVSTSTIDDTNTIETDSSTEYFANYMVWTSSMSTVSSYSPIEMLLKNIFLKYRPESRRIFAYTEKFDRPNLIETDPYVYDNIQTQLLDAKPYDYETTTYNYNSDFNPYKYENITKQYLNVGKGLAKKDLLGYYFDKTFYAEKKLAADIDIPAADIIETKTNLKTLAFNSISKQKELFRTIFSSPEQFLRSISLVLPPQPVEDREVKTNSSLHLLEIEIKTSMAMDLISSNVAHYKSPILPTNKNAISSSPNPVHIIDGIVYDQYTANIEKIKFNRVEKIVQYSPVSEINLVGESKINLLFKTRIIVEPTTVNNITSFLSQVSYDTSVYASLDFIIPILPGNNLILDSHFFWQGFANKSSVFPINGLEYDQDNYLDSTTAHIDFLNTNVINKKTDSPTKSEIDIFFGERQNPLIKPSETIIFKQQDPSKSIDNKLFYPYDYGKNEYNIAGKKLIPVQLLPQANDWIKSTEFLKIDTKEKDLDYIPVEKLIFNYSNINDTISDKSLVNIFNIADTEPDKLDILESLHKTYPAEFTQINFEKNYNAGDNDYRFNISTGLIPGKFYDRSIELRQYIDTQWTQTQPLLETGSQVDPEENLKYLIKTVYKFYVRGEELLKNRIFNKEENYTAFKLQLGGYKLTHNYTNYIFDFNRLNSNYQTSLRTQFNTIQLQNNRVGGPLFRLDEFINTFNIERIWNRIQLGKELFADQYRSKIDLNSDGFAKQLEFDLLVERDSLSRIRIGTVIGPIMTGLVVSVNKVILQANDKSTKTLNFEHYISKEYLTDSASVELDRHLLWDNDIEVMYGAFATEADAIAAAQNYSRFRPYLIMNTNFWSYRVLLDTGLVCELPVGRYPVAWLIRGG